MWKKWSEDHKALPNPWTELKKCKEWECTARSSSYNSRVWFKFKQLNSTNTPTNTVCVTPLSHWNTGIVSKSWYECVFCYFCALTCYRGTAETRPDVTQEVDSNMKGVELWITHISLCSSGGCECFISTLCLLNTQQFPWFYMFHSEHH